MGRRQAKLEMRSGGALLAYKSCGTGGVDSEPIKVTARLAKALEPVRCGDRRRPDGKGEGQNVSGAGYWRVSILHCGASAAGVGPGLR